MADYHELISVEETINFNFDNLKDKMKNYNEYLDLKFTNDMLQKAGDIYSS